MTSPAQINAVIFDFDGTLVDSMPLHYEAYRRVLADLGIELTRDVFFSNIGGTGRETIPKLLGGRPTSLSVEEIHHRKKALVNDVFANQPIVVLETAKLLPVLYGRFPMALASSGTRQGIEIVLKRLDWMKYFDVIITGEDAQRGKPSPDLFLVAAEGLKIAPRECLVFEDTDAGVVGAEAAGMQVFDVRRTASPTSVPGR
jgi:beta-phosphoglucomutase-like phosphatase (HAD superfamily)